MTAYWDYYYYYYYYKPVDAIFYYYFGTFAGVLYVLDLWLWLGDVVYADKRTLPFMFESSSLPDMKVKYDTQLAILGAAVIIRWEPCRGLRDFANYMSIQACNFDVKVNRDF